MNQLTITNGRRMAAYQEPVSPLADLPRWLGYLVGAYPASKLSEEAFMVMEDQFMEFDAGLLYEAAREFARTDRRDFKDNPGGFPTAREFRPTVERLRARQVEQEQERLIAEWRERAKLHSRLRSQRTTMLKAWYSGRVGDRILLAMAKKLDAAGLEFAAASLRSKLS